MSIAGKWGISRDGDHYHVAGETRDKALEEADVGDYVGRFRDPIQPEDTLHARDILDNVLCQDDYCGDWAEGCLDPTLADLEELETAMSKVFGDWIDRHGLRPTFGIIDNPEQVTEEMVHASGTTGNSEATR